MDRPIAEQLSVSKYSSKTVDEAPSELVLLLITCCIESQSELVRLKKQRRVESCSFGFDALSTTERP